MSSEGNNFFSFLLLLLLFKGWDAFHTALTLEKDTEQTNGISRNRNDFILANLANTDENVEGLVLEHSSFRKLRGILKRRAAPVFYSKANKKRRFYNGQTNKV